MAEGTRRRYYLQPFRANRFNPSQIQLLQLGKTLRDEAQRFIRYALASPHVEGHQGSGSVFHEGLNGYIVDFLHPGDVEGFQLMAVLYDIEDAVVAAFRTH